MALPSASAALIVDVHPRLLPFGLPCAPLVLQPSQQFFLLTVDRDRWRLFLLELLTQGIDVPKLLIAVGVGSAFHRLLVDGLRE